MARKAKGSRKGWVKVEGWTGGRAWRDADGKLTFHIRRKVGKKTYAVSTGCTQLAAALQHLTRFEADPEGYRPAGEAGNEPITLTAEMVEEFLRWQLSEKGNSASWIAAQRHLFAWWAEKLGGVNLRRVDLRADILDALEGVAGRAKRIEVIKSLFGWLRKVKRLVKPHQDPTFGGVLTVPPPKPAQWSRSKVIPRDHYLLAREHLVGAWRDALDVLAGTGWHITEVIRFANAGELEPLPKVTRVETGAVGVLLCPLHKSGAPHRTAVGAEVLEAAKRLRERGWPSDSKFPFYQAVESACRAAGIAPFSPGRFRHSVASWAIESGAAPAAVAAFLGHKSPATTKRFYAVHAVAPKVPTLL